MTTVLLTVGAIWSERAERRLKNRKQDKQEYLDRFEELKAENAKRQSIIDSYHQSLSTIPTSSERDFGTETPALKTSQRTWSTPVGDMQRPPSYEIATQHMRSHASSRTTSIDSRRHG
jgi:hypothetical protein